MNIDTTELDKILDEYFSSKKYLYNIFITKDNKKKYVECMLVLI